MAWNEIKTEDVLSELTPAEQLVLKNIQGGTDELPAILTRVIGKVRGCIKAGGNQIDLSSDISIPDQLASETIAIARWKWLASIPALKAFKTDERKKANDDAEALLKEISSQSPDRPRIELPPQPDATSAPSTMPSTGASKLRRFRHEDGIV